MIIPPQSLGTLINQFVEQCNYRVSSTVNIFESVRSNLADVAERVDENHDREIRISDIEEQLKGFADVGPLQTKLMAYNKDLREKTDEQRRLNQEIGSLQIEKLRYTRLMQSTYIQYCKTIIKSRKRK